MAQAGKLPTGSVLAIDHGTKRCGFAVADALRLTLTPLAPYHGPGDGDGLIDHIAGLAEERTLSALLIGLPMHLDQSQSEQAKLIRSVAQRIARRLPDLHILFIDEHLTSKEAEARLVEAGYTGQDRKDRRDSWSALVMLEEWIANGEPLNLDTPKLD
ncbi:MAG: Holliday junction resolvase RuvX [Planctomycetes bacterium]|nr:Holliday junction resolvase RuvX [Planctomycetota bacterium]